MTMSGKNQTSKSRIAPEVARQIDENLKRLYADRTSEALPDSLSQLLDALRQKETNSRSNNA